MLTPAQIAELAEDLPETLREAAEVIEDEVKSGHADCVARNLAALLEHVALHAAQVQLALNDYRAASN